MRFVFLGAPGSGKGTQSIIAAKSFKIPHISTGDIFRENIKDETELGKLAKSYIDRGELCPDELTVDIIKDRIQNNDCKNGFILDGFPRTIAQAKALKTMLDNLGEPLSAAILLDIADKVIVDRMSGRRVCSKCGRTYHVRYNPPKNEGVCDVCNLKLIQRDDDVEETVLKRLKTYHEQSEPLVEYYANKNKLISIDATLPVEDIARLVYEAIAQYK